MDRSVYSSFLLETKLLNPNLERQSTPALDDSVHNSIHNSIHDSVHDSVHHETNRYIIRSTRINMGTAVPYATLVCCSDLASMDWLLQQGSTWTETKDYDDGPSHQ